MRLKKRQYYSMISVVFVLIGTVLTFSLSSNEGRKWILNNGCKYVELKEGINKLCYTSSSCYYKDKSARSQQVIGLVRREIKNEKGEIPYKAPLTYNYLSKDKNGKVFEVMKEFILDHYHKEDTPTIQAIALVPVSHIGGDSTHPLFSVHHIRFIHEVKDMDFSTPEDCDILWDNHSNLITHEVALTQNLDDFFNKKILGASSICVIIGAILSLVSITWSNES